MYNALLNTFHSSSKVLQSFKLKTATLLLISNTSDLVFWNNKQACLFFYLTVFKILKRAIHFKHNSFYSNKWILKPMWGQNFHTSFLNFIILLLKCRVEALELGQIFNRCFMKEGQTSAEYWETSIFNILYFLNIELWVLNIELCFFQERSSNHQASPPEQVAFLWVR